MIRIALLRHGHTDWNRAGRIQGRTDRPLDEEARAALRGLRLPAPWDAARIWSSPLARARQTAECLAGRPPEEAAALTEMDWGSWEGRRGRDLLAEPGSGYAHIEDWGWDFRPPGGESPRDVWARLMPWLESLSGDCVMVAHIGVIRVLLARAFGWPFRGPPPFAVKRNRLYLLEAAGKALRPAEPLVCRLEARR